MYVECLNGNVCAFLKKKHECIKFIDTFIHWFTMKMFDNIYGTFVLEQTNVSV